MAKDDTYLTRSNFVWVSGSNASELPATHETIASRKNGDMLRGRSGPSKCDRTNEHWGSRDQWYVFDDANPWNFAHRWQQYELHFACPLDQRRSWAAFSPDGSKEPWRPTAADTCLNTLMLLVMSVAESAERSWHSLRRTLATLLVGVNASDGQVQAMLRWKTFDAMQEYARLNAGAYARLLETAVTSDAAPNARLPPTHDACDHILEIEAAIAELESAKSRVVERKASTAGADVRALETDPHTVASVSTGDAPACAPTTAPRHARGKAPAPVAQTTDAAPQQQRLHSAGFGIVTLSTSDTLVGKASTHWRAETSTILGAPR